MNRLYALTSSALLALVFTACPPAKKSCKDTGCSAGSTCNVTSGICEIAPIIGGGGGAMGGGGGGGNGGGGGVTGGGGATGGGGGATGGGGGGGMDAGMDAGFDAGTFIDPLDDGGMFVPGEICGKAIPVDFDGGTVATAQVDLAAATDDYASTCSSSGTTGADLLFELTFPQETGLVVTATDGTGTMDQDLTVTLVSNPCPDFNQVACVDSFSASEVLTMERVPAGRWFVMVENYSSFDTPGAVDMQFELTPPVPAPANDSCSAPTPLVVTNGVATAFGTTAGALNDNAAAPLTCSFNSGRSGDVFYSLTLAQEQDVRIAVTPAMGSMYEPSVALQYDCAGGMGSELECDAQSPSNLFARRVPAGTYIIAVDGNSTSNGAFNILVTLTTPPPPPMNDTCAMPTTLMPSTSVMVDANTGAQDYMLSCGGSSAGGDVVYTFTLAQAQKVTLTATSINGSDAVISLRGMPCDDDTGEIACRDSAGMNSEILTALNVPAGTYFVVLQSYYAASGEFGLSLQLDPPVLPPPNDTCATPATLIPNMTQMVDLAGAAADYNVSCGSFGGGDAVYQFTTTQPQRVVITVTGSPTTDAVLELRQAPCDMGTEVACASTASIGGEAVSSSNLPAGTYFVVLGSNGLDAAFGVQLTLEPPIVVTNDTCATAETVTFTNNMATRFVDLRLATADYNAIDLSNTSCSFNPTGQEVVYQVSIPAMQTLTVTAVGLGSTDPVLVHMAPMCTMAAAVTCADDTFSGGTETLVVTNMTGAAATAFILVKTYDPVFATGDMSLTFAL